MYKTIFSFIILLFIFSACDAQEAWKLKSDRDNIKTYAKRVADSKINAVKIESVFPASLTQFVSVILDIGSYDKWIYNSRSTRVVKQVSPADVYYYSEVAFPWPTANRDFVSHITVRQDAQTKIVYVDANNVSGLVPVKPNIVRIARSSGRWIITPQAKNQVKVEYVLEVDPGGDLPAWLINPFASKGLVETFKNLRLRLQKTDYASVHLPFIKD